MGRNLIKSSASSERMVHDPGHGFPCLSPRWSMLAYLDAERQAVLLEGVEVENQLLTSFSQRGQVAIAINTYGSTLQNLRE